MPLTPNPDSLGGRIYKLMREKGFKINPTAKLIGLSGQGLRDILSGDSQSPGTAVVVRLAQLLEVSTDYLLLGQQNAGTYGGYELAEPAAGYGRASSARPSGIPVISVSLYSAYIAANGDLTQLAGVPQLTLPDFLRLDAELIGFEVEDNVLAPDIRQSAVVIASPERDNWRFLPSGHVFVAYFGGRLWVRRLYFLQEENSIELRTAGDVPPIRVPLNDVIRLWRVRLVLNRL